MKKLFTILSIIFCLALVTVSCTEEEVKPTADEATAGGGGASGEKP